MEICAKSDDSGNRVGKKFKNAVNESSDLARPLASRLKEAARAFLELANERNELVHAHVYSEPDGRQQLVYQSKDKTRTWSVTEIDHLAHRFENYSIALRDLMKEILEHLAAGLEKRQALSLPSSSTVLAHANRTMADRRNRQSRQEPR
jgi:hypothetical protein